MKEREGHPSGRPIRSHRTTELGFFRRPREEFVAHRLNTPQRDLSLIGFHHAFEEHEEDE